MALPYSRYRRQKGAVSRQISTRSKAERLMLALTMDCDLLPLKGRHGAPEHQSGPYIKQTYL